MQNIHKVCGCGRKHTRAEWNALEHLPNWDMGEGEVHEVRNCHCGSTLLVQIEEVRSSRPSQHVAFTASV